MSTSSDSNFAIICSFFDKFSELCGIERPNTKELKGWLENSEDVSPELIDLHLKLMRKLRKVVQPNKWERALIKFCYTSTSKQDAWEIERFGYKKASLPVKLRILKALVEVQFDINTKFKNAINTKASHDLRAQPVGKDNLGNVYWYLQDKKCNIFVYQENVDDETWRLVANSREEMVTLIDNLKNNVPIAPPADDLNEDDSSQDSIPQLVKPEEPKVELPETLAEEDRVSLKITLKKQQAKSELNIKAESSEEETTKVTNQSPVKITITKTKLKYTGKKGRKQSKRVAAESDSDEVGEEISDPVLHVQGEGNGNDCEGAVPEFSEVIEEDIFYVYGDGSGHECLVGNDDNKPQPPSVPKSSSFFFGPGCIKPGGLFGFSRQVVPTPIDADKNENATESVITENQEDEKEDDDLLKSIEDALKGEIRCKPGELTPPIRTTDAPNSSKSYITGVTSFCRRVKEATDTDSESPTESPIRAVIFENANAKPIEPTLEMIENEIDEMDVDLEGTEQDEADRSATNSIELLEEECPPLAAQKIEKCSHEVQLTDVKFKPSSSEYSTKNETHGDETDIISSKESEICEDLTCDKVSSINLPEQSSTEGLSISEDSPPKEKNPCVSAAEDSDAKSLRKPIKLRRPGRPLSQPNTPFPDPIQVRPESPTYKNESVSTADSCSSPRKEEMDVDNRTHNVLPSHSVDNLEEIETENNPVITPYPTSEEILVTGSADNILENEEKLQNVELKHQEDIEKMSNESVDISTQEQMDISDELQEINEPTDAHEQPETSTNVTIDSQISIGNEQARADCSREMQEISIGDGTIQNVTIGSIEASIVDETLTETVLDNVETQNDSNIDITLTADMSQNIINVHDEVVERVEITEMIPTQHEEEQVVSKEETVAERGLEPVKTLASEVSEQELTHTVFEIPIESIVVTRSDEGVDNIPEDRLNVSENIVHKTITEDVEMSSDVIERVQESDANITETTTSSVTKELPSMENANDSIGLTLKTAHDENKNEEIVPSVSLACKQESEGAEDSVKMNIVGGKEANELPKEPAYESEDIEKSVESTVVESAVDEPNCESIQIEESDSSPEIVEESLKPSFVQSTLDSPVEETTSKPQCEIIHNAPELSVPLDVGSFADELNRSTTGDTELLEAESVPLADKSCQEVQSADIELKPSTSTAVVEQIFDAKSLEGSSVTEIVSSKEPVIFEGVMESQEATNNPACKVTQDVIESSITKGQRQVDEVNRSTIDNIEQLEESPAPPILVPEIEEKTHEATLTTTEMETVNSPAVESAHELNQPETSSEDIRESLKPIIKETMAENSVLEKQAEEFTCDPIQAVDTEGSFKEPEVINTPLDNIVDKHTQDPACEIIKAVEPESFSEDFESQNSIANQSFGPLEKEENKDPSEHVLSESQLIEQNIQIDENQSIGKDTIITENELQSQEINENYDPIADDKSLPTTASENIQEDVSEVIKISEKKSVILESKTTLDETSNSAEVVTSPDRSLLMTTTTIEPTSNEPEIDSNQSEAALQSVPGKEDSSKAELALGITELSLPTQEATMSSNSRVVTPNQSTGTEEVSQLVEDTSTIDPVPTCEPSSFSQDSTELSTQMKPDIVLPKSETETLEELIQVESSSIKTIESSSVSKEKAVLIEENVKDSDHPTEIDLISEPSYAVPPEVVEEPHVQQTKELIISNVSLPASSEQSKVLHSGKDTGIISEVEKSEQSSNVSASEELVEFCSNENKVAPPVEEENKPVETVESTHIFKTSSVVYQEETIEQKGEEVDEVANVIETTTIEINSFAEERDVSQPVDDKDICKSEKEIDIGESETTLQTEEPTKALQVDIETTPENVAETPESSTNESVASNELPQPVDILGVKAEENESQINPPEAQKIENKNQPIENNPKVQEEQEVPKATATLTFQKPKAGTSKVTSASIWVPPVMTHAESIQAPNEVVVSDSSEEDPVSNPPATIFRPHVDSPALDLSKPSCGLDLSITSTYHESPQEPTSTVSDLVEENRQTPPVETAQSQADVEIAPLPPVEASTLNFSVSNLLRSGLQEPPKGAPIRLKRGRRIEDVANLLKTDATPSSSNEPDKPTPEPVIEIAKKIRRGRKSDVPEKIEARTEDLPEPKKVKIEEKESTESAAAEAPIPQKPRRGRKSDPIRLSDAKVEEVPALQDIQIFTTQAKEVTTEITPLKRGRKQKLETTPPTEELHVKSASQTIATKISSPEPTKRNRKSKTVINESLKPDPSSLDVDSTPELKTDHVFEKSFEHNSNATLKPSRARKSKFQIIEEKTVESATDDTKTENVSIHNETVPELARRGKKSKPDITDENVNNTEPQLETLEPTNTQRGRKQKIVNTNEKLDSVSTEDIPNQETAQQTANDIIVKATVELPATRRGRKSLAEKVEEKHNEDPEPAPTPDSSELIVAKRGRRSKLEKIEPEESTIEPVEVAPIVTKKGRKSKFDVTEEKLPETALAEKPQPAPKRGRRSELEKLESNLESQEPENITKRGRKAEKEQSPVVASSATTLHEPESSKKRGRKSDAEKVEAIPQPVEAKVEVDTAMEKPVPDVIQPADTPPVQKPKRGKRLNDVTEVPKVEPEMSRRSRRGRNSSPALIVQNPEPRTRKGRARKSDLNTSEESVEVSKPKENTEETITPEEAKQSPPQERLVPKMRIKAMAKQDKQLVEEFSYITAESPKVENTRARKRRMSDERRQRNSSESDGDAFGGFAIDQYSSDEESLEPSGKRAKLPSRHIDSTARKQVEKKLQDIPPSSEDDHSQIRSKPEEVVPPRARGRKNKRKQEEKEKVSVDETQAGKRSRRNSTESDTNAFAGFSQSDKSEKEAVDDTLTESKGNRGKGELSSGLSKNRKDQPEQVKTDKTITSPENEIIVGSSKGTATKEEPSVTAERKEAPKKPARGGKNKRKPATLDTSKSVENDDLETQIGTAKIDKKVPESKKPKVGEASTGTPKKKFVHLTRDLDPKLVIDSSEPALNVRQSRRIAEQKIREEADRRKMEEVLLAQMKAESEKKKRQKDADFVPQYEDDSEEGENSKGSRRRGKAKVKKGLKWHSNSESESSEPEEEEEEHEPSDDNRSALFKSDHEFSCESDVDDALAVPTKRARTVKKEDASESEDDNPDHVCQKCTKSDHPEWILLCDNCDKGYHCSCLTPVLFLIPEGDWFCPTCQHVQLIQQLELKLNEFDVNMKAFEISENLRRKKVEREKVEKEEEERKAEEEKIKEAARKPSQSESPNDDSSSGNSSDDEPIYKLRRRNQVTTSYRFNEFDDLINSAIRRDMKEKDEWFPEEEDEDNGAGNKGRGKDISTIIEAEKEEKRRQSLLEEGEVKTTENDEGDDDRKETKKANKNDEDSDDDDEPIRRPNKSSKTIVQKKKRTKPKRRLNQLDVSSGDEDSDESFKGTSGEDSEENEVASSAESESSLELAILKKRLEKGGRRYATRRRQTRDRLFINDNDSDEDVRTTRKKKKKADSDELEFSEDEEASEASEESEDVDSDELCDDTGSSTSSEYRWSKRKKSSKGPVTSGKSPRKCFVKKKVNKDEDKSFRAGISKKKVLPTSDKESGGSDNGAPLRKTRGRQMHYLEDDFESSDDGIKPGVYRPDTPPEEREKFIKKQEEIKRMLAEKNTEAAKALATPKSDLPVEPPLDNISIIPASVIENAKALDTDIKKTSSVFDDLPDDFNSDEMDDEELAKMMEEEDFAQHPIKISGDIKKKGSDEANKKPVLDPSEIPTKLVKVTKTPRKKDAKKDDTPGPSVEIVKKESLPPSVIVQTSTVKQPPPLTTVNHPANPMIRQLGPGPIGPPNMYQGRFPPGMPPQLYAQMRGGSIPPQHLQAYMQNPPMFGLRGGPGPMPRGHPLQQGQNPALRSLISMPSNRPPPPPLHNPLAAMTRMSTPPPQASQQQHLPATSLPRPLPEANIPTTVVAKQNEPMEPVKKRGRRKKITPLRDDLPKNDPSQSMMQMKPEFAAGSNAEKPKEQKVSVVSQAQLFDGPQAGPISVITKALHNRALPPHLQESPRTYPSGTAKGSPGPLPLPPGHVITTSQPPRHMYPSEQNKSAVRLPPDTHAHQSRLPMGQRPQYRVPPGLIVSGPTSGVNYHESSAMHHPMHLAGPPGPIQKGPTSQRPPMQGHPNYPGPFPPHHTSQYPPYYPPSSQPPPTTGPPSQRLQPAAANRSSPALSAGSTSPYPENRTPQPYHAASSGDEEPPAVRSGSGGAGSGSNTGAGEFSGLVSYFSSQQDDLNS